MRNYLFISYFALKKIQSAHIFLFGENLFLLLITLYRQDNLFVLWKNYTFDEPFKPNMDP